MSAIIDAIMAHAAECQPRECCGLVVTVDDTQIYVPCRNIRREPDVFELHPVDWIAAESAGRIVKIVHSHVNRSPAPTQADRIGCEAHGLPWLIVSWPSGEAFEFAPAGYEAPYVGRSFVWGMTDCFTLLRDYYRRELGILIPDFGGYTEETAVNDGLYESRFEAAGFREVFDLRSHDVLLMNIPTAGVQAQHAAVYVGGGVMLHHLQGRLSQRQPYGGMWEQITRKILRHESL
jgi:proteasome lid subunit RPN8/RPN11